VKHPIVSGVRISNKLYAITRVPDSFTATQLAHSFEEPYSALQCLQGRIGRFL
jgi:hypothetical protein